MKTIISHFYNEEYLLPWWLNHHKQMFDHGIIIDYQSTDRSREIIKSICPNWTILDSRNKEFEAAEVDKEVEDLEKDIKGWRMVLNITEFLIGDISILDNKEEEDLYVESMTMIDHPSQEFVEPDPNKSLLSQRTYGFYPQWHSHNREETKWIYRHLRKLTKVSRPYKYMGRHYLYAEEKWTEDFLIACYYYSPYTNAGVKRKLQIQDKMCAFDKKEGRGIQHLMDETELNFRLKTGQKFIKDLYPVYEEKVKKYLY